MGLVKDVVKAQNCGFQDKQNQIHIYRNRCFYNRVTNPLLDV